MKPLRVLLIGAGVIVALVGVAVLLAFNSGVQTWAARRALAAQPDLAGEIGQLDAGLNHIVATSVRLMLPEMEVTLPRVEADLSLLGAAGKKLSVHRLVARGWTVDTTRTHPELAGTSARPATTAALVPSALAQVAPASAPAASAAVPVADVLAALQLPVDLLVLDGLELEGDVIFRSSPDAAPARARVRITGGGLKPGADGKFVVHATSELADPTLPVGRLELSSDLTARLRTPRTFARLTSASTIDAQGGRLPNPARLLLNAVAEDAGETSAYQFDLRTPEKELFQLTARPEPTDRSRVAGSWQLAIARADVAPFVLGLDLPDFAVAGAGEVHYVGRDQTFAVKGQVKGQASQLQVIEPRLESLGSVSYVADFEAQVVGDNLRFTALRTSVAQQRPILELQALQGFEYSLNTGELRVADPDADLFTVNLQGLPMEWANVFVAPYQVSGSPLQGTWAAAARDGGFALRPTAPLRSGKISIAEGATPLLQNVDLALSLSGEYLPTGWQARVEDGHLQSGTIRLVEFDARAGQAAAAGASLVATSRYHINLGGWRQQPVAAPLSAIAEGSLAGEFIVALNERTEAAAEFMLSNVVAQTGEVLPQFALDLRADVLPDGRVEVYAPLRVTRGGRASDITLTAQLQTARETPHVDAVATGQHLFVQDLQLLLAPFAAADTSAAPPTSAAPGPEVSVPGAVWAGVEGTLKFTFGTVVYSDALSVTNVSGDVAIGPEALRIPALHAVLGTGGEINFQGQIAYDATAAETYALQGQVQAAGVDVGKLMKAVTPNAEPPVEGTFDLATTVSGRTSDLAQLADRTAVDAKLTSRGGTLRALSVKVGEYVRSGSAIANVAGLIGSITGDSRTQRYAERFKAATDLAEQLATLNFDQLNLDVVRTPGQAYTIKDLSLISPTIRLLGQGEVGDQVGRSFWTEPLQLQLQLAARGTLAENLKTLRLLREDVDTLGYLPMVEQLTLQGSLSNITAAQLQSLISRALAM